MKNQEKNLIGDIEKYISSENSEIDILQKSKEERTIKRKKWFRYSLIILVGAQILLFVLLNYT